MRKFMYVFLIIIAIFVITNPSLKSFDEYIDGYKSKSYNNCKKRTLNLFVVSTYTEGCWSDKKKYYIGVLGNFFEY